MEIMTTNIAIMKINFTIIKKTKKVCEVIIKNIIIKIFFNDFTLFILK